MEGSTLQSEENLVTLSTNMSLAKFCYIHIKKLHIEKETLATYINDDVLNRFLLARDHDEKKAFKMWSQWVDWRIEFKPEYITERSIERELRSGKAFLHGYDKEGRPCVVVKNCKHIPEESDIEELIRFVIYTIDLACRKADEIGVKQICVIADREGTSYANWDKRFLGKMNLAGMLQDYYAERLHKVYILYINWVFKMLYNITKPFISEKTKSKMTILSDKNDLKNYFSEDNLLKEHGGVSDYVYKYES